MPRKKELEEQLKECQEANGELKRSYHAIKADAAQARADAIAYKQQAKDGYSAIPLYDRLLAIHDELDVKPTDPPAYSDIKRALNYLRQWDARKKG